MRVSFCFFFAKMYNLRLSCLAVFCALLLSSVCLPALGAEEESETESEYAKFVEVLKKDNFDDFIAANDFVLVKFYAPWCHYCKKLAPAYEEAAYQLWEKKSAVKIAKVDCTVERDLADTYEIKGYPTLKLFRKGVPDKFSGGRTSEEIVTWLETMSGPSVSFISADDLEEKLKGDGVIFVAHLKSKDSDFAKTFEKVGDSNRRRGLFFATEGNSEEKVVVHRGDETPVPFTGTGETEMTQFVDEESFPLFGPIHAENFMTYAERTQELVWFCGEKTHFETVKDALREVAAKTRSLYSFVWLNSTDFSAHATDALGVTKFPCLVYQSKEKGRFLLEEENSLNKAANVEKFFADVHKGDIEKNVKSEKLPESNDAPVKIVVGKTFEEVVITKDKDVMLEVYAPWCKHCKELTPKYDLVAEAMQDVDHIVIAKMDGTLNEAPVPHFDWTGFPTIYFLKAGTDDPLTYDGARTTEALLDYIKKNASTPIEESKVRKVETAEAPADGDKAHDEL